MGQLIFLVEAKTEVRQRIQSCLDQAGYSVRTFSTINILREAEIAQPRLILTAMKMPEGTGLDLYRHILQSYWLSKIPLMFLLDPAFPGQRLLALESGADGFVLNSAVSEDLTAQVRVVLQRHPVLAQQQDLVIDVSAMRLSARGMEVPVTSLEFRLIEYLSKHRGQVFTRDQLLDAVWGDVQFVTPRSVDACIRRIRKKIEPNPDVPTFLKTVRGTGYRVDAVAVWQLPAKEVCDCKTCKAAITSHNSAQHRA